MDPNAEKASAFIKEMQEAELGAICIVIDPEPSDYMVCVSITSDNYSTVKSFFKVLKQTHPEFCKQALLGLLEGSNLDNILFPVASGTGEEKA